MKVRKWINESSASSLCSIASILIDEFSYIGADIYIATFNLSVHKKAAQFIDWGIVSQ